MRRGLEASGALNTFVRVDAERLWWGVKRVGGDAPTDAERAGEELVEKVVGENWWRRKKRGEDTLFGPMLLFPPFFFPSEGKPVSFPRVGGGWAARNDLMNGISSTPLLSNHSGHLPLTPFTFPTSASSSSPSPVLFYLLLLRFPHQFERFDGIFHILSIHCSEWKR